ncbi:MAG: LysR family transcriptional regulator [Betaproteobacteria bacterium]|nr:LysR family transcriptional regulator [Betaproteobacteria bacterium]
MENFRALNTFVRIVRGGSFSKAARELGISPQAVSNQIRSLERWVGVRLFNRTTRKISLTEEGLRFYTTCVSAIDAIDEGVRNLHEASEEVFGTVRLAAPHGLSWRLVAPLIGRFLTMHPRLSIELIVQNRLPDLVAQGIDVGVLGDPLPESSMVARRFGSVQLVLCATPAYLRKNGTPQRVEDLAHHQCINFRNWITDKVIPWTFKRGDSVLAETVPARFITNDGDSQLQAVLSGAGIAQLSSYRIAPYVRANRLKPLLLGHVSETYGLYVYLPRRKQVPKKARALADFLFEELRIHPDLQIPGGPIRTPRS